MKVCFKYLLNTGFTNHIITAVLIFSKRFIQIINILLRSFTYITNDM